MAPCPPRLLLGGRLARDHRGLIDGLIWPQDGWRLDRLAAMAAARLSSPGLAPRRKKECAGDIGSPIPREARKSLRRHPPLRSGPDGCAVDRLRPVDRHRDRDGRGLGQPGSNDMATI